MLTGVLAFLGRDSLRMLGVALAAAMVFGCGWKIQGWRYEARIAALDNRHAQALAAAHATARAIEQQRLQDLERLSDEAGQKLAAVVAAERAAADLRVRDVAARYAARARRTPDDTAAPCQCEASAAPARVLADLLGELDELAQGYARAADRARVAGLACEAAFEAVRVPSNGGQ